MCNLFVSTKQVLAPSYALSHTYKRASCKAACMMLTSMQADAEVHAVKQVDP